MKVIVAVIKPFKLDDVKAALETLGVHGQLMVELVPELEFIIGKQPAVPDLPPQEAQNRSQLVFRRFLGGRLWATPNEPRGTVFSFTVPIGEHSLEKSRVI